MAKKSEGKTKRERAKSEIFKAKGLEKAGKIGPGWGHPLNPGRIIASGMSTNFSGYPEKSKYEKSLEKHKKDYPKLVSNIKYDTKKEFKKVKPSHQKRSKHSSGGGIGIQTHGNKLARALNTKTPDHSKFLNEYGYLKGGVPVKNG